MDQRFEIGRSFEKMLKEKCDDFRMYPSQKVWHSIYNNVHPGRRWPSISISIALIAVLLVAGYFNTTKIKSPLNNPLQDVTMIAENKQSFIFDDDITPHQITAPILYSAVSENKIENTISTLPAEKATSIEKLDHGDPVVLNNVDAKHVFTKGVSPKSNLFDLIKINQSSSKKELEIADNKYMHGESSLMINTPSGSIKIAPTENFPDPENMETSLLNKTALQSKPSQKKWADKLELQVYATPSVIYSQQSANTPFEENNLQRTMIAGEDPNGNLEHKPALGLEAGAAMQYSLTDIFKVKAGLQLNYTNYHIDAYEANHSVSSALKLNDFTNQTSYLYYSTSSVSNIPGGSPLTLSNKTYQLSLPVGVEFKVAGNDDLQLNIGATIQPTFLLGDNAYLISADRRNYINTPSLLNQWNLNAGFETFISYKVNGITWQLGPQFRRQLSSSYDKKYTVNENLNNYGLKFGISRTIQ